MSQHLDCLDQPLDHACDLDPENLINRLLHDSMLATEMV